jgi:hypothetical protein
MRQKSDFHQKPLKVLTHDFPTSPPSTAAKPDIKLFLPELLSLKTLILSFSSLLLDFPVWADPPGSRQKTTQTQDYFMVFVYCAS